MSRFNRNRMAIYATTLLVFSLHFACNDDDATVLRVTGQIEGATAGVGSRIGGRVVEKRVEEGDRVTIGQTLVILDSREANATLARAKAEVAQATAELKKLEEGTRIEEIRQASAAAEKTQAQYLLALRGARSQEIAKARATAESLEAEMEDARQDYERVKGLYEAEVASAREYDQAQNRFEAAEKRLEAAREELDLLVEGTREERILEAKAALAEAEARLEELENGPRIEDIEAARARCLAAKSELDRAEVLLSEMTIEASIDGVIESIDLEPGDIIPAGPAVTLLDPEDLEVVVYVSSVVLGRLREGQEVTITTDSHGDETFSARIIQIANEGEFTPRNLQTEEERVQQVFGVRLAMNSHGGKLRPGMTAIAHIPLQGAAAE